MAKNSVPKHISIHSSNHINDVLTDPLEACLEECKKSACKTDLDFSKGCNQMFSCSHACKMRDLGVSQDECNQNCERNTGSGCTTTIKGHTFSLCEECNRAACEPTNGPTIDECKIGCKKYSGIFVKKCKMTHVISL